MTLTAGKDNEKNEYLNAVYLDGYECDLPDDIKREITELKMKMKRIWQEYLEELKKWEWILFSIDFIIEMELYAF